MAVPPVPIFLLFAAFGLREFVILPVILGQKAVPGLIFVIVPAVIVLRLGNLWGALLGTAADDQPRRRRENRRKKNGTKVSLRAVHYECLALSVSRKNASGTIPGIAYKPRENARSDINVRKMTSREKTICPLATRHALLKERCHEVTELFSRDDCAASSNRPLAPFCWPSRIRVLACAARQGSDARLDFRDRPSGGSPCDRDRTHDHLAPRGQPRLPRAPRP